MLHYHYLCLVYVSIFIFSHFFFNDPPAPEICTLSLHDALPISRVAHLGLPDEQGAPRVQPVTYARVGPALWSAVDDKPDRKSTRLNSSHTVISYAVFCLKKKKKKIIINK